MTVNKFLSINSDHEKVAVVGEDGLEAVGEDDADNLLQQVLAQLGQAQAHDWIC